MLRGLVTRFLITWGPVPIIGGMCYTIYLYHPFLKSALKHLTFPLQLDDTWWLNVWIQVILLGLLIVLVSYFLYLLFEKPFMYRDWPQRIAGRLRSMCGKRSP
jgi:peptidoglycan/LPS O-acetylase OafA/YrhL